MKKNSGTKPKEQVYDTQIYPLMDKVIKICKDNNINLFATFGLDKINEEEGPLYSTTSIAVNDKNCSSSLHIQKLNGIHYGRLTAVPSVMAFTIKTEKKN